MYRWVLLMLIIGWSVLVCCGGADKTVFCKMEPNEPVINFLIPMFGESGYKTWDLKGQKGYYINQDQIDIEGLMIQIFSGDECMVVETVIESPSASVYLKENRAEGQKTVVVSSNHFYAIGTGWEWGAKDKKIILKNNVKVLFKEPLKNIIK